MGGGLSPAHPAPELVELAEAEAVGVLDDDEGGIGHIHPYLHHSGGHQYLGLPPGEGGHSRLLLPGLHLPVEDVHPQVGKDLLLQLVRISFDGL